VASLITISTPHHGSPAAAYELSLPVSLFRWLPALQDLTIESMRSFNEKTPDHADVVYRSYSAARPLTELPWLARHYGRAIAREEGDNDSQVSVTSAKWGEHVTTLVADHFELIGLNLWLNPFRRRSRFDHMPLYREIAQWIAGHENRAGMRKVASS
jgi:triacylglycerol lipase